MSKQIKANGKLVTVASPIRSIAVSAHAAMVTDIVARRKAGESVKAIANSYAITTAHVYTILKQRGLGTRTNRRNEECKR